ncbi:putative transmembrane protein [Rhizobium johnstonii 3841]|uniref:Transmembrane protein n=2 Tax=Rhizobium/Agrobacterium group TaxID=227290 RepID=Q1MHK0_RHIJ3|nr:putative transmembrane protein [Rhizobium johnstonii 3841]
MTPMGTKIAKAAFLVTAMMFFAVLALDIAIPTLVLCIMALSTWLVSLDLPLARKHGGEAA